MGSHATNAALVAMCEPGWERFANTTGRCKRGASPPAAFGSPLGKPGCLHPRSTGAVSRAGHFVVCMQAMQRPPITYSDRSILRDWARQIWGVARWGIAADGCGGVRHAWDGDGCQAGMRRDGQGVEANRAQECTVLHSGMWEGQECPGGSSGQTGMSASPQNGDALLRAVRVAASPRPPFTILSLGGLGILAARLEAHIPCLMWWLA